MDFKNKVETLINKALEENPSLFLIEWNLAPNNAIKVVLDGDNGVSVEDCVTVSRAIEHNLDREEEDFSLEVTSCGIFSPLVLERQFVKNIGRTLWVQTEDTSIEGTLISVENQNINIETQTREPKPVGKGKITVTKTQTLALSQIKEAKVVIKF